MSPSFVELLQAACSKSYSREGFARSHPRTLAAVAADSEYELHGLHIRAPGGVYSPHATSSTRFLMDHFEALGLSQPFGQKRFLEIGCGAGAIAMLAARNGWQVTATDIDEAAVLATRANAARAGLQVDARASDLFAQLTADETFDVIVFNQPFWHVDHEVSELERPLCATGGQLHERFMAGAAKHLAPEGHVVFSYSNCSDLSKFHQPGWVEELAAFDYDAAAEYIRAYFVARPQ